jgi:hypothetical protein
MLLCGAVPLSQEELMEDDSQTLVESRLERKQLLEEFPNYELSAVHSVSLFLTELLQWTEIAEGAPLCSSSHLLLRPASKNRIPSAAQMKPQVLLPLKAQKSSYLHTKQEARIPSSRV